MDLAYEVGLSVVDRDGQSHQECNEGLCRGFAGIWLVLRIQWISCVGTRAAVVSEFT